ALSAGCRAHENARPVGLAEATFSTELGSVVTTPQHDHALAWVGRVDLAPDEVDRPEVGGEDDDLLVGIGLPECTEPPNEAAHLGLPALRKLLQQLRDALPLL